MKVAPTQAHQNSGHFFNNNTMVRTNSLSSSAHFGWGQVQFNNGDQQAWDIGITF